jgi:hypothetical protein
MEANTDPPLPLAESDLHLIKTVWKIKAKSKVDSE